MQILAEVLRVLSAPTQTHRLIQIATALPEAALVVTSFRGTEGISEVGEFVIECASASTHWSLADLLGEEVTLRWLTQSGSYRHWHGYVHQARHLGTDGGMARYQLQVMPWPALLTHRQDCYVFHDQSVQDILTAVFADHVQARFRFEVSAPGAIKPVCTQFNESDWDFAQRLMGEMGWSYRFEHDQASAVGSSSPVQSGAPSGTQSGGASSGETPQSHHTLVIFDRHATLPDTGAVRFHRINATERSDTLQALQEHTRPMPSLVTVQSFNERAVASVSAQAQGEVCRQMPATELHVEASPGLYRTQAEAQEGAEVLLAALRAQQCTYLGEGSVRTFQPGTRFTLTQHDRYEGRAFTLTQVTHQAVNNLGLEAARLWQHEAMKTGTYAHSFTAQPAEVPVVIGPRNVAHLKGARQPDTQCLCVGPLARPTHARLDTALVVGIPGTAITSDRDHRIHVQYHWQRGAQPNAGGLTLDNPQHPDDDNAADDNAPGNERGLWIRVGELLAGPNYGSSFTPRIGDEVVIQYLHQDIDCPIITGSVYNGQDLPPFSAGQDSQANHPGVLKGIHSTTLDGAHHSQWQSDATPGQLRTRLMTSQAQSELNLGYLIDQPATTAHRGAYRGEGAELTTQGWHVSRMGEGMLISSTARPDRTHSATGNQMDVQEATAQLKGGQDLHQRLTDAAIQAQAHTAVTLSQSLKASLQSIDLTQQGKYTGPINGQATTQPASSLPRPAVGEGRGEGGSARFEGGDPVPKFAQPHVMLDSADDRLTATPASQLRYASGDLIQLTQQHRHDSAQHTHSQISGEVTSLYAHQGGLSFIAANGPVSLQSHDGNLTAHSQQQLNITSTNGEINIVAPHQITLMAGDTKIELNGSNVTLSTSGQVDLKGNLKQIAKGLSGGTELPTLPKGRVTVPKVQGVPSLVKPPKEITAIHWSYGPDLAPLSGASRHYVDMNLHIQTSNYDPGESVAVTLDYPDQKALVESNQTLSVVGQVDEKGEAVIRDVFKTGSLNLNWRA